MKKILSFLIVATTIYLVACNVEEEAITQTRELLTKNPYAISIPQAIERLNTIFPDATKTTRTTIANVTTLTRGDFGLTTRSISGAMPTDPLIYIVPTANNGCAIVGADKRMEAVYAVLESTMLTAEDILNINTRSTAQEEEDIKDFVSAMLNDAITYNARMVGTGDSYPSEEECDTIILVSMPPMLKTKWHQNNPYVSAYPNTFIKAGCGPIALSQILYYLKQPSYIVSANSPFNWNQIALCEYGMPGDTSTPNNNNREAARFIYEIAQVMDATPGGNVTGVLPNSVLNVMQLTKFRDVVDFKIYNSNLVREILDQSLPVYITGFDNNAGGHAWVIDGYEYRAYYKTISPTSIIEAKPSEMFFHCNFGAAGEHDGYYLNDVFNLREIKEGIDIDSPIGDKPASRPLYYQNNLRVLKYNQIY